MTGRETASQQRSGADGLARAIGTLPTETSARETWGRGALSGDDVRRVWEAILKQGDWMVRTQTNACAAPLLLQQLVWAHHPISRTFIACRLAATSDRGAACPALGRIRVHLIFFASFSPTDLELSSRQQKDATPSTRPCRPTHRHPRLFFRPPSGIAHPHQTTSRRIPQQQQARTRGLKTSHQRMIPLRVAARTVPPRAAQSLQRLQALAVVEAVAAKPARAATSAMSAHATAVVYGRIDAINGCQAV